MTLKNRGRSKKTEGRTRPKSKGGSLSVGTYLQRGSAPPPPGINIHVSFFFSLHRAIAALHDAYTDTLFTLSLNDWTKRTRMILNGTTNFV